MVGLLGSEGAPAQEGAARARGGSGKLLAEPRLGEPVGLQEPLARPGLDAASDAPVPLLVAQPDADSVGQVLDGLGEGQLVDPLDEGDDVPALAAAEAVPQPQLGADVEGGGALVVERAQPLERPHPPALESDVLADDILDLRALAHRVDVLALDQPRHGLILGEDSDMADPLFHGPPASERTRVRLARAGRTGARARRAPRCPLPLDSRMSARSNSSVR